MQTATTPQALQIRRVIRAPREKVFAAFASLEGMKPWFGPSAECRLSGELDFREGAGYRIVMENGCEGHGEAEGPYTVAGRYREIRPPEKVVFTWQWEGDPEWAGLESVVTVDLREVEGGTELRLTQQGFPNEASRERHGHGWEGSLEKLARACGG